MKCYSCGNDVPEESIFCGMCGARLELSTEEPEAAPIETTEDEAAEWDLIDIIIDPEESEEPITEPEEPVIESEEPVTEPEETEHSDGGQTEEFVLNHCPYCGAALMSGAKFCSNCGNSITVYERNMRARRSGKIGAKMIVLAVLAAIAIIWGMNFLSDCRSIEGEWKVEKSDSGFFDVFGESYLDFGNDGIAVYYDGFFTTRQYEYTYNRFTKILTLKSAGYGVNGADSRLHVEWIDPYTITIRELNMTLYRIEDIPYYYEDSEFDNNDVVIF